MAADRMPGPVGKQRTYQVVVSCDFCGFVELTRQFPGADEQARRWAMDRFAQERAGHATSQADHKLWGCEGAAIVVRMRVFGERAGP